MFEGVARRQMGHLQACTHTAGCSNMTSGPPAASHRIKCPSNGGRHKDDCYDLYQVFQREGNLDSSSFKKLVSKQLGGIMEDADSSAAVKEMQKGLDDNSDGKVNFEEYFHLIGYLAKAMSQKQTGTTEAASS
ncbi:hypothetical protein WMY93_025640 [Mugilogobius chulae]|uniref:EF-hand domain-containing protein n=1 Tax=Mugilogobius chulae TaxID=88201 RepID=A0AAW0MW62_9GOBI